MSFERLRPGQVAVGYKLVEQKLSKLIKMSDSERSEYRAEHSTPVVLGPEGSLFMLDRHHTNNAFILIGFELVLVDVKFDWSSMKWGDFWVAMKDAAFLYLYDEVGRPVKVEDLPNYLWEMSDDPYRSLATFVRKEGKFKKSGRPFEEFYWARLFQEQEFLKGVENDPDIWEKSIKKAVLWRKSVEDNF